MTDDFPAEDEPDGDVLLPHHLHIGLLVTAFGFLFVWPTYPQMGAAMTLIGVLVTADDAISHAFGVWTPLDWFWKKYLKQYIS